MKPQRKILVSSVILVLGCVATVLLASAQTPPRLRQAYSIVFRKTHTYADGTVVNVFTETKWVATTGDWFSVKVFPDGRLEKRFGKPGLGVYMYNPSRQRVDYVEPFPLAFPNPKINLKSSDYMSTVTVLGYSSYLLRRQTNGMSIDTYIAPGLNGDIIQQVITKNGVVMRLDPVSVQFLSPGDPVPPPSWSIP